MNDKWEIVFKIRDLTGLSSANTAGGLGLPISSISAS